MDGIDSAIDEAKILLDIKMGNVQPEEFDLEINEGIGDFEREVLSDEMVMEKIKDLIRDNAVDPSDVMEEVGQEFGVAFEFGRG